jgi:ankyrin repeat protein
MASNVLQLFCGIESDDPIAVKAAIESGCDVNGRHQGETPLQKVVRQGKAELVSVLLKHGADWSKRSAISIWSPLMLAEIQCHLPTWRHFPQRIKTANRRIIRLLRDAGATDPETDGILGRIQDEQSLLEGARRFGATADTEVTIVEGLVIVFPKRLKKTQIGKLMPSHKLGNAARHYKLRLLARQLRSGSQP